MTISDYSYDFPDEAIALYPPEKRGETKLFVVNSAIGTIDVTTYSSLLDYFDAGDCIVRNNTKVFRARLFGTLIHPHGEKKNRDVEVFLIEPHAQSLEEYVKRVYDPVKSGFRLSFMGSLKRRYVQNGAYIQLSDGIRVEDIAFEGDSYSGIFKKNEGTFTPDELFEMIESNAEVPLPPYLNRKPEAPDLERYQTVFAKYKGSVAAPTASLNFTKEMEIQAERRNIDIEDVTLHVGRGTFLPLKNEKIEENILHTEPFFIPKNVAMRIRNAMSSGKKICALGTTVTRTLESSYEYIQNGEGWMGDTNLFIYPPYNFEIVNTLLTNFHFPKSSLITLVDAFLQFKQSKLNWKEIYDYAIREKNAKLFSYGDSMLIL